MDEQLVAMPASGATDAGQLGNGKAPTHPKKSFWEHLSFWDSSSSLCAQFNKHCDVLMRKWQLRYDRAKNVDDHWWVRENVHRQREWERLCRQHDFDPKKERPDEPRPKLDDARPEELREWLPEIIRQVELDRSVLAQRGVPGRHHPHHFNRCRRWAIDLCTEYPELGEPPEISEDKSEYDTVCQFLRWFKRVYEHFQHGDDESCGEASPSVIPLVDEKDEMRPGGQLDIGESSAALDLKSNEPIIRPDHSAVELQAPQDPQPFRGGKIVFFPDRVELCGVDICSGRRSERRRSVLDLLRIRIADRFVAYSGKTLAERLCIKAGKKGAPGAIRDLRISITKTMLSKANVECGPEDVIQSGESGYHLSDKLSVQDDGEADGPRIQCHNVINGGTVDGTVPDPVNETDPSVASRRDKLLAEVKKGRKLRAPALATELGCSLRTVKRDLEALGNQIEFVGSPRNGHYQLRQPP